MRQTLFLNLGCRKYKLLTLWLFKLRLCWLRIGIMNSILRLSICSIRLLFLIFKPLLLVMKVNTNFLCHFFWGTFRIQLLLGTFLWPWLELDLLVGWGSPHSVIFLRLNQVFRASLILIHIIVVRDLVHLPWHTSIAQPFLILPQWLAIILRYSSWWYRRSLIESCLWLILLLAWNPVVSLTCCDHDLLNIRSIMNLISKFWFSWSISWC